MKRGSLFIYFLLAFIYSGAQQTAPVKDINKIVSISNEDYDMGKISAGKPLEYNLVIKNISKDTVVLQDVKVGCGCTTPKFRAGEKLLPGKSTFITLGFNGDANGAFMKTADIVFAGGLVRQVKFRGVTFKDSTAAPAANN
jgi:hypothetical protein